MEKRNCVYPFKFNSNKTSNPLNCRYFTQCKGNGEDQFSTKIENL